MNIGEFIGLVVFLYFLYTGIKYKQYVNFLCFIPLISYILIFKITNNLASLAQVIIFTTIFLMVGIYVIYRAAVNK